MKKKSIILAVVAMLMLAATACGQKTGENKVEDNKVQIETNNQVEVNNDKKTDTSEETEAPTDAPEVTAEPEEEPDLSALITINGKEYDLSGDFQEVVGTMVRDGLVVTGGSGGGLYDEQGRGSNVRAEEYDIYAMRSIGIFNGLQELPGLGSFVGKHYGFINMEELNVVSKLGISSVKGVEQNIDTTAFLEMGSFHSGGHRVDMGYVCVFVNGNALDFSEYEDKLEEIKKKEVERTFLLDNFSRMSVISYGVLRNDVFKLCRDYDDIKKTAERCGYQPDENILLQLALEDVSERVEAGNIDKIAIVSLGLSEEGNIVGMDFNVFSFE